MEVRDAEWDARQAMLDKTCTQVDQSVTQYAKALKRAVRDIPRVADGQGTHYMVPKRIKNGYCTQLQV
jgi:hypothetical protein